jgi:hypothetical protein
LSDGTAIFAIAIVGAADPGAIRRPAARETVDANVGARQGTTVADRRKESGDRAADGGRDLLAVRSSPGRGCDDG